MTWIEKDAYYVYVLTDADGEPVYIGQTGSVADRLFQHFRTSPWWRYVEDFELFGPYPPRCGSLI